MNRSEFSCIDAHTCGNPVRVVRSNQPHLEGSTMSEKRQHFLREYDWIRTGLMFEPRGHDAMSGSILYPPIEPDGDLGVLFIEVSGCLPMCGHGTIGTVTVALERGLVTPRQPGLLKLDTPAGHVEARYVTVRDTRPEVLRDVNGVAMAVQLDMLHDDYAFERACTVRMHAVDSHDDAPSPAKRLAA